MPDAKSTSMVRVNGTAHPEGRQNSNTHETSCLIMCWTDIQITLLSVWQIAWDRAKPADTHKKKGSPQVWFGICISCAAIHSRFPKVVFVVILCRIVQTYFAAQEEELPLNILCGSRLFCQWELCSSICRTGKGIAAEQHFWAGLFSQWLPFPNCDTIRIWWSLASWHLSSDLLSNVSLSSSNPGPN